MKMNTPLELDNVNHLRTAPDRYWRRVILAVNSGKITRVSHNTDNLFHECCRFVRRYRNAEPEEYEVLYKDFPTIMPAFQISDILEGVKWHIEAGLTAGAAFGEIGAYVGESETIVRRYSKLFYDVQDWLTAEGCIYSYILRPKVMNLAVGDVDFLYKTIAYHYGWESFKSFINCKELTPTLREKLTAGFRDNMIRNTWMASQRIRPNNYNACDIIAQGVAVDTLKVEEGKSGVGGLDTTTHDALKALLEDYTVRVSSPLIPKQVELIGEVMKEEVK